MFSASFAVRVYLISLLSNFGDAWLYALFYHEAVGIKNFVSKAYDLWAIIINQEPRAASPNRQSEINSTPLRKGQKRKEASNGKSISGNFFF